MTSYLVSRRRSVNVTAVDILPFDMIDVAPMQSILSSQPEQSTVASRKRQDHRKVADVDHAFPDYDREHSGGCLDRETRSLMGQFGSRTCFEARFPIVRKGFLHRDQARDLRVVDIVFHP